MASSTYHQVDQPEDDGFSDSDNEYNAVRASEDVRNRDQETLNAEEEAERLLAPEHGPSKLGQLLGTDGEKSQRTKGRRQRRRGKAASEKKELMYEMEEGGPRSSSAESSANSSEVDMHKLGETQSKRKTRRARRFGGIAAVHVVIIAAFIGLLYGAYRATMHSPSSSTTKTPSSVARTLSNGTHTFAPTTILLSLDGFRADFLARGLTPTLNGFIRAGVSPRYMQPAFPSLTFPNHFTLVTGLHPESHGIVGNTFWDPSMNKEFTYGNADKSMQPEWWNAEPLWLTASQQGVRSAIHMWPGSEAHIGHIEPAFVDEFNAHEELDHKVDRILHWLDLPGDDDAMARPTNSKERRPQFIAAYVPNVDADGHRYGPNSTYIRSTIAEVDGMLGSLFKGIDERNLTNVVNIIVVSDHGMATTSNSRLIQLEDIIDPKLIEHTDGWPLYGLRPYKKGYGSLKQLYNTLSYRATLPHYKGSYEVYLRDESMPERFHFTNNDRIAPLWIVPYPGWAIVTKDEFNIKEAKSTGEVYMPRGLHGYDHEHPLMRAIFVARGPAFPHPKGSRVAEFQNIEVYNIVCDSLGLEPRPNNGTLRLPFTTNGKHDFNEVHIEVPDDLSSDDDTIDAGGIILPPDVPDMKGFSTNVRRAHGNEQASATVSTGFARKTSHSGSSSRTRWRCN